MKLVSFLTMVAWVAFSATVLADQKPDVHAEHALLHSQASTQSTSVGDEALPPGEENAKAALEKSPRHGEYVDIKVPGNSVPIRTWVVYPERKDKAPVIIVIQEIFGLSDWIRAVADQLAEDGFIAVAPDLICGKGPNNGCTDSVASRDDVVKLVRALTPDEVEARLNATREYALKIPAGNKKIATVGYCWGGLVTWVSAARLANLACAICYYGGGMTDAPGETPKCPVMCHFGEWDQSIPVAGVDRLKAAHPDIEVFIYPADHGFNCDQRGAYDAISAKLARERTVEFLRENIG